MHIPDENSLLMAAAQCTKQLQPVQQRYPEQASKHEGVTQPQLNQQANTGSSLQGQSEFQPEAVDSVLVWGTVYKDQRDSSLALVPCAEPSVCQNKRTLDLQHYAGLCQKKYIQLFHIYSPAQTAARTISWDWFYFHVRSSCRVNSVNQEPHTRSKPKQELQEALAKSQVFTAGTGGKKKKKSMSRQPAEEKPKQFILAQSLTFLVQLSCFVLFDCVKQNTVLLSSGALAKIVAGDQPAAGFVGFQPP